MTNLQTSNPKLKILGDPATDAPKDSVLASEDESGLFNLNEIDPS